MKEKWIITITMVVCVLMLIIGAFAKIDLPRIYHDKTVQDDYLKVTYRSSTNDFLLEEISEEEVWLGRVKGLGVDQEIEGSMIYDAQNKKTYQFHYAITPEYDSKMPGEILAIELTRKLDLRLGIGIILIISSIIFSFMKFKTVTFRLALTTIVQLSFLMAMWENFIAVSAALFLIIGIIIGIREEIKKRFNPYTRTGLILLAILSIPSLIIILLLLQSILSSIPLIINYIFMQ